MAESLHISSGTGTKIAKVMVVHSHLTSLRQGQVCFPMHLYGKIFRISNDFSSGASGPVLLKFHVEPSWGRRTKDC